MKVQSAQGHWLDYLGRAHKLSCAHILHAVLHAGAAAACMFKARTRKSAERTDRPEKKLTDSVCDSADVSIKQWSAACFGYLKKNASGTRNQSRLH